MTFKLPIVVFTSMVLTASSQGEQPVSLPGPDAEYAVYSAVLGGTMESAATTPRRPIKLVIVETTASEPLRMLDLQKEMSGVDPMLVKDFVALNRSPIRLDDRFRLPVEVVLVSRSTIRSLIKDIQWDRFYSVYPNSGGYWELSRVAFHGGYALLYVANLCGPLCGRGGYYLLKNFRNKWALVGEYGLAWIS